MSEMSHLSKRQPEWLKKRRAAMPWIYGGLVGGAVIWCSLIFLTPVLQCKGANGQEVSALIFRFFSPICHQNPARSLSLCGHVFPVCGRCFGIYIGFLFGTIVYPIFRGWNDSTPHIRWLAWTTLPSLIDFILSITGLAVIHNQVRFAAGLILGAAAAFYVAPAMFQLSVHSKREA